MPYAPEQARVMCAQDNSAHSDPPSGSRLAELAASRRAAPVVGALFAVLVGATALLATAIGGPTARATDARGVGGTGPSAGAASESTTTATSTTTSSGTMTWPVAGGGHITQYFHSRHGAVDIAAPRGTTVKAARAGTVQFSGWRNNGGGYQVWMRHGSGVYTTYNHMSALSVRRGAYVSRGQRVGRVGSTGYSSGNHLHFEVWRGPIWNGGYRVNPLRYTSP